MAGFVSLGNNRYVGTFKAAEDVENGQFVVVDYAEGTAKPGAGDYFVQNVNTNISEYGIDDVDFKVKKGEFLRLYKALPGNILVTTKFTGDLSKGDKVTIGEDGNAVAGEGSYVVKDLTIAYGTDALSLLKVEATPTP